ncbi:phage tail assembly protein [Pseudomonas nitroreducens]|uniref:Phage tail assembly protein n=1 Tax=Pseudomonas nitroreducens TaxID=46680 RepID=A0ABS0KS76_PSENT|nr:phage tail assembly protein [Pseudomonas nitroreducens]MBG6290793.1 phage tail assembly protein [Pseudomonas nitroreducens]
MTDASGCRPLTIGGRSVTVREMTVAQVRQLMDTITADTVGDSLMGGALRLHDLSVMSSLSAGEIDEMTPTQLQELAQACREVNRHFFEMLERLTKVLATR